MKKAGMGEGINFIFTELDGKSSEMLSPAIDNRHCVV
jgi:hypothetical protein